MTTFDHPLDVTKILRKKKSLKRYLLIRDDFIEKNIAILGGSTTSEIKDILELFLLKNGIKPSFKNWTRSNRTPIVQTSFQETIPETRPIESPIQQTIIKRHVLGKTKNTRQVGVMIKNISTRKMIIGSQKDLKKININEIKTHLKNNGLLKVGTTAPNELIRQTYESSIFDI